MSEQDAEAMGLETPEGDAVEQHTPLRDEPEDERARWTAQIPFDVNEADAAEQKRLVELDEDDYR
ncbi:MAG TPA: hypothetical protein VE465_07645 [Streptosporangiaceae bacterium]|jgi:hypothetical protein|nr:hypothetical protein [Streptosporangiaceae bacterium]